MKVKFMLSIGQAGGQEEIVDLPDGMKEDEIYKEVNEWIWEYIDCGYTILENGDEDWSWLQISRTSYCNYV